MSSIQLFFAIVGVVTLEIGVVTTFMFHGFSRVESQINQLIQFMVGHEGRISTLEERTKGNQQ
jgi:hypothetical protein